VNLSLVQMNAVENVNDNVERACHWIDVAVRQGADLIVLPEFFNTFYFFQYRDYDYIRLAERDDGCTMVRVREKARQHRRHVIATIYEEDMAGLYYDTAMLIAPDGSITGKYRKTHPGCYRSLEGIYFRAGSRYPVFDVCGWKVGIAICYDTFFPESIRCLMLNGAELVCIPFCASSVILSPEASSLPSHTGEGTRDDAKWSQRWATLMSQRAIDNVVYLAPCNHVGLEGAVSFAGGSCVVDPDGRIVGMAEGEGVLTTELDRELLLNKRRTTPFLRDRRPHIYGAITRETDYSGRPGSSANDGGCAPLEC